MRNTGAGQRPARARRVLLPVFVCEYEYWGTPFRVFVGGHTGAVHGIPHAGLDISFTDWLPRIGIGSYYVHRVLWNLSTLVQDENSVFWNSDSVVFLNY